MSTSWTTPDQRRVVSGTAFGQPYERVEQVGPPVRLDVFAGVLTAAVTVLLGAPVGLLWGMLAPRVGVVPRDGQFLLDDVYGDARAGADVYFLGAVVLAGVLGGFAVWLLAHRHGPAVVVGLAVGGYAAAQIARTVGEQVGLEDLRSAVASGAGGVLEAPLELLSTEAVMGWPVGALTSYLLLSLVWKRG